LPCESEGVMSTLQVRPPKEGQKMHASYALGIIEGLSPQERKLCRRLVWHASKKDGQGFPGRDRLAAFMGLSEKQITRLLNGLEGKGLIRRIGRRGLGLTNAYAINWDRFTKEFERYESPSRDMQDVPTSRDTQDVPTLTLEAVTLE